MNTRGVWGEELAVSYLRDRGYLIIERNAWTSYGEIDLVCRSGSMYVFVEVKARRSKAFGHPEEAVTRSKRVHLVRAAAAYVARRPGLSGVRYRIDVIAIAAPPGAPPEIRHLINAVEDLT